jgi:hypothetical protein
MATSFIEIMAVGCSVAPDPAGRDAFRRPIASTTVIGVLTILATLVAFPGEAAAQHFGGSSFGHSRILSLPGNTASHYDRQYSYSSFGYAPFAATSVQAVNTSAYVGGVHGSLFYGRYSPAFCGPIHSGYGIYGNNYGIGNGYLGSGYWGSGFAGPWGGYSGIYGGFPYGVGLHPLGNPVFGYGMGFPYGAYGVGGFGYGNFGAINPYGPALGGVGFGTVQGLGVVQNNVFIGAATPLTLPSDRWNTPLPEKPAAADPIFIRPKASTPEAVRKSLEAEEKGDQELQRQKWAAAYMHYKRACTTAEDRPDPQFKMGYCLAAMGRFESAVVYFRRGLALDPSYPNIGPSLLTVYGLDNELAKSAVMERIVNWAKEDIRDSNRLFLTGLFLHFDRDTRAREVFETAYRLAGKGEHLEAFLYAKADTAKANAAGQLPPAALPLQGPNLPKHHAERPEADLPRPTDLPNAPLDNWLQPDGEDIDLPPPPPVKSIPVPLPGRSVAHPASRFPGRV